MMDCKEFIRNALKAPLPGEKAHGLMAPSLRFTGVVEPDVSCARNSGVLVLIYPVEKDFYIPFIQRPDYPGAHGGQISLPGGKCEEGDSDNWGTALRETNEELGIDTFEIEQLGELTSLYIPNSNFMVFPKVGYLPSRPVFNPNSFEVSEVIEVSVKQLLSPSSIKRFNRIINGHSVEAPYYDANGYQIWGATAMMLSELVMAFQQRNPRLVNAIHSYSAHSVQESP